MLLPSGPSIILDVRAFLMVVERCLSILVDRSLLISPSVCSYEEPFGSSADVPPYDFDRVFDLSSGGSSWSAGDTRCPSFESYVDRFGSSEIRFSKHKHKGL